MIESSLLQRLRGIGFAPSLLQSLVQAAPAAAGIDELAPLRVVEVQREGLVLHDGQAECSARLYPALRTQLAAAGDAIACGDWVLAERNTFGEWWVHTRLPPLNQLARRLHDGRDKVERVVIVSNVDTALLVMGLDHDFNLRRLERYVALVRMAGVAAVVVLTKRDLAADAAARLQQVQAVLPADVMAVAVNALGSEPREQLEPWLQPGQTLVLLETPDAMRGRVSAVNSLFIGASNQLGEFESGATAAVMGPVGSVVLGGVCTLAVAGLWLRVFPTLAQRDALVQAVTAGRCRRGERGWYP